MTLEEARIAKSILRAAAIASLCIFTASCASTSDPFEQLGLMALAVEPAQGSADPELDSAESMALAGDDSAELPLPETVAALPSANPLAPVAAPVAQIRPEDAPAQQPAEAVPQTVASIEPETPVAPRAARPSQSREKRRSFLSAFFSPSNRNEAAPPRPERPLLQLASLAPPTAASATGAVVKEEERKPARKRSELYADPLPGVRANALFEINRRSGTDDDGDIDLHEDGVQVASAAGLARLTPNGLIVQHEGVETACLKPALLNVLNRVERHYGRNVMVTSGFRSRDRNRRANGARNSLHMYCAAADVQVPGVSKWELAKFVRSMPGRGGVGTYCHTESVHVDVGPERDWNWRCRRRKKN